MKSIKEAEQITGITTQNIRYYEKQKLLTPKRNRGNSYREYSDEDINRLKMNDPALPEPRHAHRRYPPDV